MPASVGSVFLEVVPSLKNFGSLLSSGTMSDVKKVGQDAGKEFGSALSAGSTSGLDALKSQLSSAALATERASTQVAQAHATAANAADKVQVAEAKLAATRQKFASDSPQVLQAEARLSAAKRDAELQSGKTALAEKTLTDAQDKQAISAGKLKDAQEAGTVTSANVAKAIGVVAVGAAAAGVALGSVAVKSAADFQTQLTRLTTTAGESTGSLKDVSSGILSLAGQTGISATDLANGMYTIESAGYHVQAGSTHAADGLAVLKAAAEGAKMENADLGTVSNAVTDILTDYHLPAQQAADVTSKLIQTVSLGKTNFEDLSGAMSTVAPIASAANIPLQDMLGSIAEMTAHGVSAEQATQNLANAIRTLQKPTPAMTQALGQFGIRSDQLSASLGKTGVSGALESISAAIMQKMGPSGQVLLNSFNQSKLAAEDANKMLASMPPNLQKLAQEMQNGKITQNEWTQGLKSIDPIQANLLRQWLTATKQADGFSQTLKAGGPAALNYSQAMAAATGNATTLNVALMLTGENADSTSSNISKIADATDTAGGNVSDWSEVQNNFNQRLAEAKAGMGAFVIEIGQHLLPLATQALGWVQDFTRGLTDMGTWVKNNASWIGLVASVIGGLAAPILAVKVAMEVWSIATKAVAVAQAALNLVMEANPIMLIVTAIAALVAGLVYAYFHFQTFRNIVNDIGNFFKAVFLVVIHAVGDAISWVADHWKIFAAILALIFAPIAISIGLFVLIVTHVRQIGDAFVWLWNSAIKPTFDFIGAAAIIIGKIILAVLIAPVVIAVKVLGAIFSWLYDNAIKPAFDAIGTAANWLYDHVFKPVFDAIGAAVNWVYQNVLLAFWNDLKRDWQLLQDALNFLYNNVWKPVWDALGVAVNWVYQNVLLPIWNGLKRDWQLLQDAFNFLYNNVIKPVWDALGQALSWTYHNVIEPVWNYFKQGLSNLQDDFKTAVGAIGGIWDGLKKALGTPIEFTIRTILNDGLIKGINWILKQVGIAGIPNVPDPNLPTFATGGVVPGYAPGKDIVHALLSPGEGVLIPQAVAALGGEQGIEAINKMFGGSGAPSLAGGLPGFAGGGVVSDILGTVGGALNGLKNLALGGLRAAAQGFFNSVVNPLVGAIPGGPGNIAKQMLTGLSNQVETDLLTFLGQKDSTAPAIGGAIPAGQHLAIIDAALSADGIPRSSWAMWEAGLNTLIQRESGWSASAVNNWDSNAQRGTPSTGLAQVIAPTFAQYRNPALANSMFDPVANVAAAIRYILARYGSVANVQQANANLPPRGYDEGGYLQPGMTSVVNATGRPEPVFNPRQWEILRGNLAMGQGGDQHNYNITTTDPVAVAMEIERRQRLNLTTKL